MVQPVSFWGLVLEPLKMYSQQVPVSFKITMASLGPEAKEGASRSTVMLVHEKDGEFALCSLTPGKVDQQPLDIVLRQGDTIHLRVEGDSTVHLVGYYVDLGEEEDEEMDSEMSEGESLCSENMVSDEYDSELDEYETEDDSEEEDEEDEDETEESEAEMTDDSEADSVEEAKPRRKGPKITLVDSEEEESEEEEDSEFDEDSDNSEEDSENSEIENDEELDSDELCNSEDEEEEVVDKKRKAPAPTAAADSKKPKLVTPQATPKSNKTADMTASPSAAVAHQNNRKELPKVQQQTPQTPKVAKEQTPKASPAVKASPAAKASPASAQKENARPAQQQLLSKTLPNGVSVQDLNLGEGIKAQKGRKVSVTVTLASQDGKPLGKQNLTFTCGSNEQAKGLDAGIIGMALNGERKLAIPAGLMKDTPVVATVKLDKVVNTK